MNEHLRLALQSAGWRSGTYKGFLMSSRVGIEFQVGPARKTAGEETEPRLELRYRYHTETTHADGEVNLPADANKAQIEDAMTSIYQRVHEKPDMSRVFGKSRKTPRQAAPGSAAPSFVDPAPPTVSPEEAGQATFDL